MAGWGPTSASTVWPDDERTGVDGNERPSSSAVRASPTTGARSPRWPHTGQLHAGWSVPHQPHRGGAAGPGMARGPWHSGHRAPVRQRSQARAAA